MGWGWWGGGEMFSQCILAYGDIEVLNPPARKSITQRRIGDNSWSPPPLKPWQLSSINEHVFYGIWLKHNSLTSRLEAPGSEGTTTENITNTPLPQPPTRCIPTQWLNTRCCRLQRVWHCPSHNKHGCPGKAPWGNSAPSRPCLSAGSAPLISFLVFSRPWGTIYTAGCIYSSHLAIF